MRFADAPKVLTISCATGDMEVPAYPSGVPGLLVHPAPGYDELPTPLWVLAHEASGFALAKGYFLLGKGEARLIAAGLADLADWRLPIDPDMDVDLVRYAYESATVWRDDVPEKLRDVIWHIGDAVIAQELSERCDGKWHRIDFGWGQTFLSLSTSRENVPTVMHFSRSRTTGSEGRVWSYEDERYRCLDCGLDV